MAGPLDIAIIGMEGLFAKAPNKDAFWSNILNKVSAITEADPEWLGEERLLDPNAPPEELRIYTNYGGFLKELSRFDPRPHGTMPISVLGGETDQFLALDVSAAVLQQAGYGEDRDYDRSRVGCILGHAVHANRGNVNGFEHSLVVDQVLRALSAVHPGFTEDQWAETEALLRKKLPKFSVDTLPALVPNMMTGRICNRLNLMGPNYILDGACASTSLALLAAADELRHGRADMMLAGGINTTSSVLVYGVFSQLGALSRSSKVQPFSQHADGTLLGEGQGVFLLKRLNDALRDDDQILAVIKGIGISSDGRSSGLMAPWQAGEALAIERAYSESRIDPTTIDLLEAHGTGIPLGDRTEIAALKSVFGARTEKLPHIAMGSVKSMIGHCIPAAGAASLMKVTMALQEKILPPTLIDEPSKDVGIEDTAFYLNPEARPWIARKGQKRRAGIDSFGFGGINSHILVEESPRAAREVPATFSIRRRFKSELFLLGADTPEALIGQIDTILNDEGLAECAPQEFATLADQLAETAEHSGSHRLGIVAATPDALRAKLEKVRSKIEASPGVPFLSAKLNVFFSPEEKLGKVAFLFPGEHSQYDGMLSELAMASPKTRAWLDRLEDLLGDGRRAPHRHLLFGPRNIYSEDESRFADDVLARVEEGSEAVFFADIGYYRLLSEMNIEADMMVGHSTGENAALIASGQVDLDEEGVSNFIRGMNTIFVDIENEGSIPEGVVLSVGAAAPGAVDRMLAKHDSLRLTMDNCPNQALLFGPKEVIEEAQKELAAEGAVCVPLPLSWAYHTEYIKPLADRFAQLFEGAPTRAPKTNLYSCSTASLYPERRDEVIATASAQYCTRVRFTELIERLYEDGARIFVEVGASTALAGFVRDTLRDRGAVAVSCDHRKKDSLEAFQIALAQLFVLKAFNQPRRLVRGVTETRADLAVPALPSHLPMISLKTLEDREELRASVLKAAGEKPTEEAVQVAPALTTQTQAAQPMETPVQSGAPASTIRMRSLTKAFGGAVDAAVLFELPHGDLDEVAETMLTAPEKALWADRKAKATPSRQREWLTGRLAVKRAVLEALGMPIEMQSAVSVEQTPQGVPFARVHNGSISDPLHVSISHKNGIALGAMAAGPVGVDLECIVHLRNATGMEERVLTSEERSYLDRARDRREAFFICWSLKEAAAKALGSGFVGQEQAFSIEMFDEAHSKALIRHGDDLFVGHYCRQADYIIAAARPTSP